MGWTNCAVTLTPLLTACAPGSFVVLLAAGQLFFENEDGEMTEVADVKFFGTTIAGTNMSELKKGG